MKMQHLSAVKKLLIFNFVFLLLFQIFVGFRDLDDYLVIFIFVLFFNDLYFKLTKPSSELYQESKIKRIWMTAFLMVILLVPVLFDHFQVKNTTQSFISKIGLILWAQAFLLDSFLHYRETNSKKWLFFANVAGIFIVFFSIAI
jgi:hypothetical protein